MALRHSPKIVTDGLIFALDAGNTRCYPGSGTSFTDLSKTGPNGSLINGTAFLSSNGGVFDFDGSNDYIQTSSRIPTNQQFTISIWIKRDDTGDSWFINQRGGEVDREWQMQNYQGNTRFAVGNTSNTFFTADFDSSIDADTTNWYNLVGVKEASNILSYQNSEFKNTAAFSGTVPTNNTFARIGVSAWDLNTNSFYHNGKIGPITVYNRALSASEIAQNYNALKSRFGL